MFITPASLVHAVAGTPVPPREGNVVPLPGPDDEFHILPIDVPELPANGNPGIVPPWLQRPRP